MDKTPLVAPDIDLGRLLLEELTARGTSVTCAFWYYPSPISGWCLMIVMPRMYLYGTPNGYVRVQRILRSKKLGIGWTLEHIRIIDDENSLFAELSQQLKLLSKETGFTIPYMPVRDILLQDAYMYWIRPRKASARKATRARRYGT